MKGYKGMLRDRLPSTINIALLWCNAKTAWVDHAYNAFIGIYSDTNERLKATKIVLGLKNGKQTDFSFEKTIDWENLSPEDIGFWRWVESWVNWFTRTWAVIENYHDLSLGDAESFERDLNAFIKMENSEKIKLINYIKNVFQTKESS